MLQEPHVPRGHGHDWNACRRGQEGGPCQCHTSSAHIAASVCGRREDSLKNQKGRTQAPSFPGYSYFIWGYIVTKKFGVVCRSACTKGECGF